jgi:hypothetical protein
MNPKKSKSDTKLPAKELSGIYQRIREILEAAQAGVARTVNTTQVVANWLIGREIVEEEQKGRQRAAYGERLLLGLADRLRIYQNSREQSPPVGRTQWTEKPGAFAASGRKKGHCRPATTLDSLFLGVYIHF